MPIFRREGIDGQDLNAIFNAGFQNAAYVVHASLMPYQARAPALLRPTPIAIHDDPYMKGHGWERRFCFGRSRLSTYFRIHGYYSVVSSPQPATAISRSKITGTGT